MSILEPGKRDEEFEQLNALIEEAAHTTDGFLGEESLREANGRRVNAIYLWGLHIRAFNSKCAH